HRVTIEPLPAWRHLGKNDPTQTKGDFSYEVGEVCKISSCIAHSEVPRWSEYKSNICHIYLCTDRFHIAPCIIGSAAHDKCSKLSIRRSCVWCWEFCFKDRRRSDTHTPHGTF
ncbi:unnamed protein product, partial [Ectocarpus sp. 13 AM-2016]